MSEQWGAPRQAGQTTDYSLTLPVVVNERLWDGHDDPPRLFAGHRAILADAGLKAMGLDKRLAMTTLLPSYEFGLPRPHVMSAELSKSCEPPVAR
jgi:hypothetical protein